MLESPRRDWRCQRDWARKTRTDQLEELAVTELVQKQALVSTTREPTQVVRGPAQKVRLVLLSEAAVRLTEQLRGQPRAISLHREPALLLLRAEDPAVDGVYRLSLAQMSET